MPFSLLIQQCRTISFTSFIIGHWMMHFFLFFVHCGSLVHCGSFVHFSSFVHCSSIVCSFNVGCCNLLSPSVVVGWCHSFCSLCIVALLCTIVILCIVALLCIVVLLCILGLLYIVRSSHVHLPLDDSTSFVRHNLSDGANYSFHQRLLDDATWLVVH